MPYRVVMEVVPRPNDTPAWIWNETNVNSVSSNGGKGWTAKLDSSDSIWEYDNQSDANAKMSELDSADSTNRRYKVIEV